MCIKESLFKAQQNRNKYNSATCKRPPTDFSFCQPILYNHHVYNETSSLEKGWLYKARSLYIILYILLHKTDTSKYINISGTY